MPSFWNSPEGGMTTLHFIVSNCIGHNETGMWPSDKDSDVMELVLTIATASTRSDSSFRFVPCIFSKANRIERADFIWRSHTHSILLAVGEFLSHRIHWLSYSSMNSLIFLWFTSEYALFSSELAPTKFLPLLVLMAWTFSSSCYKSSKCLYEGISR